MPIYEFGKSGVSGIHPTTFHQAGIHERRDLQRLLRENIHVVAPDVLVIAEEFGEWDESRRRIDLLAIDRAANIVVIELKRTEDGGHMELQAIRYAAMVSTMTFDQVVEAYTRYLAQLDRGDVDPRSEILEFLDWEEPDEDSFGKDVRIVLASAEFSKELTSSVMWLNDHDIDIRCVRLKPYDFEGRLLVDVQQIIPLPEAAEYQVQVREKVRKEREARSSNIDFTRFDVRVGGNSIPSMWKRQAILAVCKHLCESGVEPDAIAAKFSWRSNRVWRMLPGDLDSKEFLKAAEAKAEGGEWNFTANRWFCADDELVRSNGATYALSNQWGGQGWFRAMNALKDSYPDFEIEFTPAS
jgi:hypothetical protein